jgi:C4-dicarboxylate-specific signal transduction histidine kinase
LRKAHDELEKRVEERTADLAKANEVLQAEITERKRTEETLRKSLEREARAYAQGRLEIVDTILHNIGNAINNVT